MDGNRVVGLRISLPLVLFMLAGCAAQAPLSAYPGGEAQVHEIESMAEQGNVLAQVKLGEMYEFGTGEPQDYGKAEALYQQAADKGDMQGEIHLADYLLLHSGNYLGAIKWDRKAMDQGSDIAAADLWYLYYYCLGVPCHLPDTQTFYEKAMASQAGQEEAFYMVVETELMRTRNTENTTKGQAIYGTAFVEFDYDGSGSPINVKIKKSSGDPAIDAAVIKVVADTKLPSIAVTGQISHHFVFGLNYVP
jgi:TonB family protein